MDRYGKGARRERLIKRTLEGLGYRVMRSAGGCAPLRQAAPSEPMKSSRAQRGAVQTVLPG